MITVGIKRPSGGVNYICFCKESWASINSRYTCPEPRAECTGKPSDFNGAYLPIGWAYCPASGEPMGPIVVISNGLTITGTGKGGSKVHVAGCMFSGTWSPDCAGTPPFVWGV